MSQLIKNVDEQSFSARANRFFLSGTVAAVDPISSTVAMNVGATLPDGTAVYHEEISYSPQNQPTVGDHVNIGYGSDSPHSAFISAMKVGPSQVVPGMSGNNATQTINNAGVTSLQANSNAALRGPVKFVDSTSLTFTQTGQQISATVATAVMGISAETGGGASVGPESVLNFASTNSNAIWTVTDNTGVTPHQIDISLTVPSQTISTSGGQIGTIATYSNPTADVVVSHAVNIITSNASNKKFLLPPASANDGVRFVLCFRSNTQVLVAAQNGADTVESVNGRGNVTFCAEAASTTWWCIQSNTLP